MLDAPRIIAADPVEHLDDRSNVDREPGLLAHFPRDRVLERLPHLDAAAGQAPLPLERRVSALDEQHAVAVEHDGTDADDGLVRGGRHDDSPRTRRASTRTPRLFTFTSTVCSGLVTAAGQ